MSEETRQKLSLQDLVEGPTRPYHVPIPRDGLVFGYRFIKEVGNNLNKFLITDKLFT